jgi:putative transposase
MTAGLYMPFRLTRIDKLYDGYLIYFVTCCTHSRLALLANADLHAVFLRFGQEARTRKIFVGRYVIMPDHIHFFVTLPDEFDLSMWMKSLKNSLSKTLRLAGHPSPHWQKGFFDHVVRSEQSYEVKWIYVYENPVRKGLVTDAALWPFQGEVASLPFD